MDTNRTLGILLIAIGLLSLLAFATDVGGEIVVGAIGVGFLAFYVTTRNYGLLVPGAILTGLGSGIIINAYGGPSAAVVLGLGAGFLAIAVVDIVAGKQAAGWWWPLIPGGILTLIGASELAGIRNVGQYLVPAGLIAVGIVLIMRKRPRVDAGVPTPGPVETHQPARSDGADPVPPE